MLSRRNLRIKVMQAMYVFMQEKETPLPKLLQQVEKSIDSFYPMYMYSLWFITKVCEEVNKEAEIKAGKHIQTASDKNYSVRIFHNPVIQSIVLNREIQSEIEKSKLNLRADTDLFRLFYFEMKKIKRYKVYMENPAPSLEEDKAMISVLIKNVLWQNEDFQGMMEDLFPSWNDDEDIVAFNINQWLEKFDPKKEDTQKVRKDLSEEKKFALSLMEKSYHHFSDLEKEIEPRLKNWDKERIAIIDLILLLMATCELLYFQNIPVKVTLNEFIEIAKRYSTPQSGNFINGILDNLVKDLVATNRLHKTGRGAIEN